MGGEGAILGGAQPEAALADDGGEPAADIDAAAIGADGDPVDRAEAEAGAGLVGDALRQARGRARQSGQGKSGEDELLHGAIFAWRP
jgi:hypothetical protein